MFQAIVDLKETLTFEDVNDFFNYFPTIKWVFNTGKNGSYVTISGSRSEVYACVNEMGLDAISVEYIS